MKKFFTLILFLGCGLLSSFADNCDLKINDISGTPGSDVKLTISLDGICEAFGCDLALPEGVTVKPSGTKYVINRGTLLKEQDETEEYYWSQFSYNKQNDGSMRIGAMSSKANTAPGEAVIVTLVIGSTVACGDYTITLKNCECTMTNVKNSTKTEVTSKLTVTSSTAINSVSTEGADAPAYNLAGQRVSDSAKGIVIKGGKKFIAK